MTDPRMTPTNDAPVTVEQGDRERIKAVSVRLVDRMRDVARQDGWALAVHGSMSRDLDLVAVPWTDNASDETAFVEAMRVAVACALGGAAIIGAGEDGRTPGVKIKPNGRRCYTLHSTSTQLVESAAGAHPYIDLSVMDFRLAALASAPACAASPDHADIMETIANAGDDWQKQGYATALAEVRDMANIGRSLLERIADHSREGPLKGWHPADCPTEVVCDLLNMLADASAPAGKPNRDFTARRIKELMDEGDGFWRACSGCQEGEDEYVSEKDYPFDPMFRCQPGGGCSECGGIGVLWDDGRGYDDITGDEEPASAPAGDGERQTMYSVLRTWDVGDFASRVCSTKDHGSLPADICEAELDAFGEALLAALARPRAAVGERVWDGVVATDPCQSADETDEDGNPCWYVEIQSIGGHSIVATIWGGTPEEVQTRADAILALQSLPAKVEG